MSRLCEKIDKVRPYDHEVTGYICDLAEFHPGFSKCVDMFLLSVEKSTLDQDIYLLKDWQNIIERNSTFLKISTATPINIYRRPFFI